MTTSDPHTAENDPAATTEDVLYAALRRIVTEMEDGWDPGIGSHGQARRAMRRYQDDHPTYAPPEDDDVPA